jgi:hypothetical protein
LIWDGLTIYTSRNYTQKNRKKNRGGRAAKTFNKKYICELWPLTTRPHPTSGHLRHRHVSTAPRLDPSFLPSFLLPSPSDSPKCARARRISRRDRTPHLTPPVPEPTEIAGLHLRSSGAPPYRDSTSFSGKEQRALGDWEWLDWLVLEGWDRSRTCIFRGKWGSFPLAVSMRAGSRWSAPRARAVRSCSLAREHECRVIWIPRFWCFFEQASSDSLEIAWY